MAASSTLRVPVLRLVGVSVRFELPGALPALISA